MTGKTFNLDDIHDGDLEAVVQRLTNEDIARLQAHRDEFVTLPCAACESTDLAPAYEANGFEYERCRGCGLMMLSPAPNAERQLWYIENSEALRFWRENMPDRVRHSRLKLYDERAEYLGERLRRYDLKAARVLEIGAGNGEFAEALMRAAGDAIERMVLVEPQPLALQLPKVEVVPSILQQWAGDEKFDLAVSWEVLEHVLQPEPMLRPIFDRLRPGGLLVLSTPNEDSFESRLLKGRSATMLYDHVRIYNPRSLRLLLERLGFEVLELETPGRLDVEIVHREYREGHLDLSQQPALRFLMEDGYAQRDAFQSWLRAQQQSSHMRCVARRPA